MAAYARADADEALDVDADADAALSTATDDDEGAGSPAPGAPRESPTRRRRRQQAAKRSRPDGGGGPDAPAKRARFGPHAPSATGLGAALLARLAAAAPLGLNPAEGATVALQPRAALDQHGVRPREDGLLEDVATGAVARFQRDPATGQLPTDPGDAARLRDQAQGEVLPPHAELAVREESFRDQLLAASPDYRFLETLAGLMGVEPWELYTDESLAQLARVDHVMRDEMAAQRRRILQVVGSKRTTMQVVTDAQAKRRAELAALDAVAARYGPVVDAWGRLLTPTGFAWDPASRQGPLPLGALALAVWPQYLALVWQPSLGTTEADAAVRRALSAPALWDADALLWDQATPGAPATGTTTLAGALRAAWRGALPDPVVARWVGLTYLLLRDHVAARAWPWQPDPRLQPDARRAPRASLAADVDALVAELDGLVARQGDWMRREPPAANAELLPQPLATSAMGAAVLPALAAATAAAAGAADARLEMQWAALWADLGPALGLAYRGPSLAQWAQWNRWVASSWTHTPPADWAPLLQAAHAHCMARAQMLHTAPGATEPPYAGWLVDARADADAGAAADRRTWTTDTGMLWAVVPAADGTVPWARVWAFLTAAARADAATALTFAAEADGPASIWTIQRAGRPGAFTLQLRVWAPAPLLAALQTYFAQPAQRAGALAWTTAVVWMALFNDATAGLWWSAWLRQPAAPASAGNVPLATPQSLTAHAAAAAPVLDASAAALRFLVAGQDDVWRTLLYDVWQAQTAARPWPPRPDLLTAAMQEANLTLAAAQAVWEADELDAPGRALWALVTVDDTKLAVEDAQDPGARRGLRTAAALTALDQAAQAAARDAADARAVRSDARADVWRVPAGGVGAGGPTAAQLELALTAPMLAGARARAGTPAPLGALASPLLRPLEAWTTFLQVHAPAERERAQRGLVSGAQALAAAQREVEAMAASDVAGVALPVFALLEQLFRPERAHRLRAILTGEVRVKAVVLAALRRAHADLQRELPGWRGVPTDLLTGHTPATKPWRQLPSGEWVGVPPGSAAPPELAADFAQLLTSAYINVQRLRFPTQYNTQKQWEVAATDALAAVRTLREGYAAQPPLAPGGAWTIRAVPRPAARRPATWW